MAIVMGMILFFSMLGGLILGFLTGFIVVKSEWKIKKDKITKKKIQITDKKFNFKKIKFSGKVKHFFKKIFTKIHLRKSTVKSKTEDVELGEELLNKKLKKGENSIVDFNCAADGESSAEHIKKMRMHEDSAYNVLKDRKKTPTQ